MQGAVVADRRRLLTPRCSPALSLAMMAALLVLPLPLSATEQAINLNGSSKIMILGGHSVLLESSQLIFSYKEEVTPVQNDVDYIFGQLQRQLSVLLDANVRYVSERTLRGELEAQGLNKAARGSINDLVAREKYTHIITSNVQMINGVGEVSYQIVRLPSSGLSPSLKPIFQHRLAGPQPSSELDNVVADMTAELARLRDASALKFIDFSCIEPKTPVDNEYTEQLQLERALSQHITPQLIGFYHRGEMRAKGYRPIVRDSTIKIEITQDKNIKCTKEVSTVKIVQFPIIDYKIKGNVAVVQTVYKTNYVALTIEFIREYPTVCEKQIDLTPLEFKSGMYRRKDPFSRTFLPQVLPEYEQKWAATIGLCPQ